MSSENTQSSENWRWCRKRMEKKLKTQGKHIKMSRVKNCILFIYVPTVLLCFPGRLPTVQRIWGRRLTEWWGSGDFCLIALYHCSWVHSLVNGSCIFKMTSLQKWVIFPPEFEWLGWDQRCFNWEAKKNVRNVKVRTRASHENNSLLQPG